MILFGLCGACGESSAPTDPAPRVPSSLVLSPDSVELTQPGDTVFLSATVADQVGLSISGAQVTWTSSDEELAVVSAGLVNGVAVGTAMIAAASGTVSDTARVTVISPGFGLDQFQVVVAGTFSMGSGGGIYRGAQPVHTVTITRAFYLQTTEVTQGQWRAIMGSNPSEFRPCDRCPVENVSWDDIQVFLARLNAAEPDADFRLPTEAEWEYACGEGTSASFGGTGVLDEMGWTFTNSGSHTHEVATNSPTRGGCTTCTATCGNGYKKLAGALSGGVRERSPRPWDRDREGCTWRKFQLSPRADLVLLLPPERRTLGSARGNWFSPRTRGSRDLGVATIAREVNDGPPLPRILNQ